MAGLKPNVAPAHYIPRLPSHHLCPLPTAPLLPRHCPGWISAHLDSFSPGTLWASPTHQSASQCVSPAHAALASPTHPWVHWGTKPVVQSSCFHSLHALKQNCYPEPTQMPSCLLMSLQSPILPLSHSFSHPLQCF